MNKIRLTNIENNEIFTYSTILIKGFIDVVDVESNLIVKHYSNNGKQLAETHWTVYKNQFKAIVELKMGDNTLVFKFANEVLYIKLIYKQRTTSYTVCPVYVVCADHDGKFQVKCFYNLYNKVFIMNTSKMILRQKMILLNTNLETKFFFILSI